MEAQDVLYTLGVPELTAEEKNDDDLADLMKEVEFVLSGGTQKMDVCPQMKEPLSMHSRLPIKLTQPAMNANTDDKDEEDKDEEDFEEDFEEDEEDFEYDEENFEEDFEEDFEYDEENFEEDFEEDFEYDEEDFEYENGKAVAKVVEQEPALYTERTNPPFFVPEIFLGSKRGWVNTQKYWIECGGDDN